ncbi:hypothetical protein AKJ09_02459 [Labilithrix luteola]|uniref:Uncharacterized protein n=1 Tax=Labilithrix luteola TaxID=1391654 RepID=A0A0K1PQH7_9BACT|nr:hypothetical protein [Labilithrix luteola]AKU95795.1 hypothetical protein AKJ09_02459 [Labilithrix luteola]
MAAAIARTSFGAHPARVLLFVTLAFGVAGIGVFAACDVEPRHRIEPAPVPVLDASAALFTLRWTVDSVSLPSECEARNAAATQITVTTPRNEVFSVSQVDCRAFSASIVLAAGSYEADAVLIDGLGTVVSQSAHVNRFTVVGNDEALRIVDLEPLPAY